MTDQKHTPGPWTVRGVALDGRHSFVIVREDGNEIAAALALDAVKAGYGKREDTRSRSPEGQPEAWANAALIASAPTLKADLAEAVALLREMKPLLLAFYRREPTETATVRVTSGVLEEARAFLARQDKEEK